MDFLAGNSGTLSVNTLNPGPNQKELPSKFITWLKSGDIYRCQLASGGGWGEPFDRDPELVLQDLKNEKITVEYAAREHGVVVDRETLRIDQAATERLRKARRNRATGDGTET